MQSVMNIMSAILFAIGAGLAVVEAAFYYFEFLTLTANEKQEFKITIIPIIFLIAAAVAKYIGS